MEMLYFVVCMRSVVTLSVLQLPLSLSVRKLVFNGHPSNPKEVTIRSKHVLWVECHFDSVCSNLQLLQHMADKTAHY